MRDDDELTQEELLAIVIMLGTAFFFSMSLI